MTDRPQTLGKYELITQIGQGGMAEVQLAIQRGPAGFEKLVVVKLVHDHLATQKDFVDMLLDEARVAALVKHPNVVDIYDLGEAQGRYFIAMEYLEGEPLLAVLRAGREGKRLDVSSTARLIADTAEGLDAAHELRSIAGEAMELVHHDVSLGNVVVLYNGQVKLVDFGVAKATQTVASARTRVQGKYSYMAPEKLRGGSGDRRSDIWSLGCVMWEALTLKRLFKGGNDTDTMRQVLESKIPLPSSVNPDIPPGLDAVVMKALARDPDERYATAKSVSDEIEEVLRVAGYGGKNDLIARYMQSTFADHITARKKLLAEVAVKGRASATVIEAAFDEPPIASGTPAMTGEFSVRFKRATEDPPNEEPSFGRRAVRADGSQDGITAVEPVAAIASTGTDGAGAGDAAEADEPGNLVLEPLPRAVTDPPVTVTEDPAVRRAASGWVPEVAPAASGTSATVGPVSSKRPLVIALVSVIVVGGAIIAYLLMRGPGTPPAAPPVAPVVQTAPVVVPSVDAAPDAAPDAASTPGPESGSGSGSGSTGSEGSGSASAASADVEAGEAALAKHDAKAALTAFERAQSLEPERADVWRGLGRAHEALNDRGGAKSDYQRYLVLAPNAADAEEIRARLAGL